MQGPGGDSGKRAVVEEIAGKWNKMWSDEEDPWSLRGEHTED